MKMIRKNGKKLCFFLPFLCIAVLFLFVPFVNMLKNSVTGSSGGFSLEHFVDVFTKTIYLSAIQNSLWISMTSTIVGLLVDFVLAMAVVKMDRRKSPGIYLYWI